MEGQNGNWSVRSGDWSSSEAPELLTYWKADFTSQYWDIRAKWQRKGKISKYKGSRAWESGKYHLDHVKRKTKQTKTLQVCVQTRLKKDRLKGSRCYFSGEWEKKPKGLWQMVEIGFPITGWEYDGQLTTRNVIINYYKHVLVKILKLAKTH